LTVTADSAGAVSFGRLVFNVQPSAAGVGKSLSNFQFKKAGVVISAPIGTANKANIILDGGTDLAAAGTITRLS